jgi:hypothetical protein
LKFEEHLSDRETIASLQESNRVLAQQLNLSNNNEAHLKRNEAHLKRKVKNQGETIQRMAADTMASPLPKRMKYSVDIAEHPLQLSSPHTPVTDKVATTTPQDKPDVLVQDGLSTATSMTSSLISGTSLKRVEMPAVNLLETLNGTQQSKKTTKGITVKTELERLWTLGIFKNKQKQASQASTTLEKRCLFDTKNRYFIGYNDMFVRGNEARYRDAMRIVAMSIANTEWNTLTGESVEDSEMRKLVDTISTNTKSKMKRLEIDYMARDHTKTIKATNSLQSLGNRSRKVWDKLKERLRTDLCMEEWLTTQLGGAGGPQQQSLFASMNRGG